LFFSNVWSYSEPTRTNKKTQSILLPKNGGKIRCALPGERFFLWQRASTRLSKIQPAEFPVDKNSSLTGFYQKQGYLLTECS